MMPDIEPFTALILAGSRAGTDPVADARGVTHKALAPIAGQPMLDWVLGAVRGARAVGRVVISTDQAFADAAPEAVRNLERLGVRRTPARTVGAALDALAGRYPIFVTTSDHPLLTPEIVDDFLARAASGGQSGADLAVGFVPAAFVRARYPDARRTWLRFSDGDYASSNLFAFLTPGAARVAEFWRRVERERKQPWRLVRAFGLATLFRFLFRRLSLDEAMSRASKVIGAKICAVRVGCAEAAIDVDNETDLRLAEGILAARRSPTGAQ